MIVSHRDTECTENFLYVINSTFSALAMASEGDAARYFLSVISVPPWLYLVAIRMRHAR